MKLSEELTWRGFVNQTTFTDITEIDKGPISFYFGVDPSADSMQIGNFASAMMVRHFIDAGHKAYLLVGGATGVIGDPDGKKDEREVKDTDVVAKNTKAIAEQYKRIFNGKDFTLVNNADWFKDINYVDFLHKIGKHVPMSMMLGREFVQSRLGEDGSGISYAEFSYSLIQAYDFVHLYRENKVTLQLCGGDQWGNSIAGVDLIRRLEGAESHVYSAPLIMNKATGRKFGKTEGGAIWLDEKKTSVYKFYQFWLNCDDEGVIDYAKIFTLLNKEDIAEMERQLKADPGARYAQRTLAKEVTALVHGLERALSAEKVTQVLFGKADFSDLSEADIEVLAAEIPSVGLGNTVISYLVEAGIAKSNGEARRLIQGGGVSVSGEKISDDIEINQPSLIKKGKNNFILVR